MIRAILHMMFRRFEADFDYNATYMHEVVNIWPAGGLRYFGLSVFTQTRGPDASVWAGAMLASTLDGDCGPCAQLIVDMALKSGVSADQVAACLRRDFDNAGAVGLGFRFAEAAINDTPQVDLLRDTIQRDHGPRAMIAASYAAASGRVYPVLKRGLGHGKICQQIKMGNQSHTVVKLST